VIGAGAVAIGIGCADVEKVDRLNVYWAAMEARWRAAEALPIMPAITLARVRISTAETRGPANAPTPTSSDSGDGAPPSATVPACWQN